MPFKYTVLLQLTTAPEDAAAASAHIAGWSESHWRNDNIDPSGPVFNDLLVARAQLLPRQAAIVGYRVGSYTLTGNKIYPGPTSTGRFRYPGGAYDCDVPQMALQLGATSNAANSSRITLRAIPDLFVEKGEYQPGVAYRNRVTTYCGKLVSGSWGFIGRDLTQPSIRVLGVENGVLTTDGSAVIFPGVDWIRFHKVVDNNGAAITGAWALGTSPAANKFNLVGFPTNITAGPNGSVRRDLVQMFLLTSVNPSRICVRKVGRPLEQYRGRRSKRRAA